MTAISEKPVLTKAEKHESMMRMADKIIKEDKAILDKLAKL